MMGVSDSSMSVHLQAILVRSYCARVRTDKSGRYTGGNFQAGSPMTRRIVFASMLIASAVALAACGSKGPLVQPDQQAAAKKKTAAPQTPPPPVQPAPDNSKQ